MKAAPILGNICMMIRENPFCKLCEECKNKLPEANMCERCSLFFKDSSQQKLSDLMRDFGL